VKKLLSLQLAVLREITRTVLKYRSAIYSADTLASVNDNSGNRINKKILQILGKLAAGHEGAGNAIDDMIKELKGNRAKNAGSEVTPTKKRKVKAEKVDA
jgi:hypothetical protein